MRKTSIIFCLVILVLTLLWAQQEDLPKFYGEYFGQSSPGNTPEVFAKGMVSTVHRVYANVTFSSDLTEACWTPNSIDSTYHWKGGIINTKLENGIWSTLKEIYFMGPEYSHRSPFYSYNGNKLYFQAHLKSNRNRDQMEKFYFVEKTQNGWSEPTLLDPMLNEYAIHWQFSVDKDQNLYFGGNLREVENTGGIYFSEYLAGKYQKPILIFKKVDLEEAIFGPVISPSNDYMLFTRLHPRGSTNPRIFSIYISFRNKENIWTEPLELGKKLNMDGNQPRISPDGKYIFFVGNDGMSYWISANIVEEFK